MVCLGNICRSPMAEGILKDKLAEKKLIAEVESAGFEPYHLGNPPDKRAVETTARHDIDITNKRARPFTDQDFDRFDKIFVMDSINFTDVMNKARNDHDMEKVDYLLNQLNPGTDQEVPDPYYGGKDGFERVYHLIEMACEKIANSIKNN